MAVHLEEFVENLVRSGLFTAEELTAFQEGLPSEKRPKDVQGLARELIQAGKLTKYQATLVYKGRTKGLVLGNYTILDQIGAGGMGRVLKARHRRMKRTVALKMLPSKAVNSPDAVKRFHREVEAAAKLVHPNIVIAHDADEHEGIHFLVMEYVEGKDLSAIVAERGPLPVGQAVDCIIQAARGLEYAHSEGIVHRDIKPGNLLLDKRGTVKILDLGLARLGEQRQAADESESLTSTGQVMGTFDYMAPEQAEDTHQADGRADIYSLGCTLYRLLTGRKPFRGDTVIQVLLAHQKAPIPSLCEARPDLPEALDEVFQRMMAKAPEARYQSMGEVIVALEACVAPQPVAAEPSSDGALTSFLEHLAEDAAPKPRPAGQREETLASRTDQETGGGIWRRLGPLGKPGMRTYLGIVGGVAAFLVVLAVLFAIIGGGRASSNNEPPPPNYALEFDGEATWVEIPTLSYSSRQLTIEARVKTSRGATAAVVTGYGLASCSLFSDSAWGFQVYKDDEPLRRARGDKHPGPERWYHLAAAWDGKEPSLFVDGRKGTVGFEDERGIPGERGFYFAAEPHPDDSMMYSFFRGQMDEVRISNIVRYDNDFAPPDPDDRFEADEHTLALYHFDEGAGDVLRDSSGNGHDGKIIGAKWVRLDTPRDAGQKGKLAATQPPGR